MKTSTVTATATAAMLGIALMPGVEILKEADPANPRDLRYFIISCVGAAVMVFSIAALVDHAEPGEDAMPIAMGIYMGLMFFDAIIFFGNWGGCTKP